MPTIIFLMIDFFTKAFGRLSIDNSILFFFNFSASFTINPPISWYSKSFFLSSTLKKNKFENFEFFI